MPRARLATLAALAAGFAGCVAFTGCSDSARSHVFSGRQLEEARGCLDPVSSIDVVDGPQPGPCDPKCIVSSRDADSGASTVYVSTMCPPLPAAPYDTSEADPRCAGALALYAVNTTCLADGGVTRGGAAGDAGPRDAGDVGDVRGDPGADGGDAEPEGGGLVEASPG